MQCNVGTLEALDVTVPSHMQRREAVASKMHGVDWNAWLILVILFHMIQQIFLSISGRYTFTSRKLVEFSNL